MDVLNNRYHHVFVDQVFCLLKHSIADPLPVQDEYSTVFNDGAFILDIIKAMVVNFLLASRNRWAGSPRAPRCFRSCLLRWLNPCRSCIVKLAL